MTMARATSMKTTTTFPAPPSTANTLGASDRARLIRSSRKLGDVLGTTPLLLDAAGIPPVPPIPASYAQSSSASRSGSDASSSAPRPLRVRRKKSLFQLQIVPASSGYSQSASDCDIPGPRTAVDERPLLLRLPEPSPVSSSGFGSWRSSARLSLTPSEELYGRPLTPTSANSVNSLFPSTPTPTNSSFPMHQDEREQAQARKRMAKLARTLGENVPPELVLPNHHRRRGTSVSVDLTALKRQQSAGARYDPVYAGNKRDEWVGAWNRHDIRDVQTQLRALRV